MRRATCGDGTIVWWSGGFVAFSCLYDRAGILIGTQQASDIAEYCDGSSFSWTWGAEVPDACIRLADPDVCRAP